MSFYPPFHAHEFSKCIQNHLDSVPDMVYYRPDWRWDVSTEESYLRAILATIARQTFSPDDLISLIGRGSSKIKQLQAYNLCDGSRSQREVAKLLGLDEGNFSRTVGRWVDEGIIVRVGDDREFKPVHVYPIPENQLKKAGSEDGNKGAQGRRARSKAGHTDQASSSDRRGGNGHAEGEDTLSVERGIGSQGGR